MPVVAGRQVGQEQEFEPAAAVLRRRVPEAVLEGGRHPGQDDHRRGHGRRAAPLLEQVEHEPAHPRRPRVAGQQVGRVHQREPAGQPQVDLARVHHHPPDRPPRQRLVADAFELRRPAGVDGPVVPVVEVAAQPAGGARPGGQRDHDREGRDAAEPLPREPLDAVRGEPVPQDAERVHVEAEADAVVQEFAERRRQRVQPQDEVLRRDHADDEVRQDAQQADPLADPLDAARLVDPRRQAQAGEQPPDEREDEQRGQVLRRDQPGEVQPTEHRQAAELDQCEPRHADEGLGEEEPPRLDRRGQQEFQGEALGQLRQPPPDQGRALDQAEAQQRVPGDGEGFGGPGLGDQEGEQPGDDDVPDDDAAEGRLPARGLHGDDEERLQHGATTPADGNDGQV